jgi:hypothetical protein
MQLPIVKVLKVETVRRFMDEIKFLTFQRSDKDGRRLERRYRYRVPVTLQFESTAAEKLIQTHLIDVSASGLSFASSQVFDPGRQMLVTVEAAHRSYLFKSKIIHSTAVVNHIKTGVCFVLSDVESAPEG